MPSAPPFLPIKCHLCEKMFQNDVTLRTHFLNHLSTSQQLVGKLGQGPLKKWTEQFTQFHFINYNLRDPRGFSGGPQEHRFGGFLGPHLLIHDLKKIIPRSL